MFTNLQQITVPAGNDFTSLVSRSNRRQNATISDNMTTSLFLAFKINSTISIRPQQNQH